MLSEAKHPFLARERRMLRFAQHDMRDGLMKLDRALRLGGSPDTGTLMVSCCFTLCLLI